MRGRSCLRNRLLPLGAAVLLGVCLLAPGIVTASEAPAAAAPLAGLTDAEQRWLAEHPDIRLGVDPTWEPFEFFDGQGRYSGMAADTIALLNQMLGTRMRAARGLTWQQVIAAARQGEVDVLPCVVRTPQRDAYLNFTRSYLNFPMVIMSRDDASFISGLQDLQGQRVGVVAGYASGDLIRVDYPKLKLVEFPTLKVGLEKLALGQVDVFVDNLASIISVIKRTGLTNIKVAGQTPFSFELKIGVRKDWPELTAILDKALASITPEQASAIQNKWIAINFQHGVDLPFVVRAGLWSAALIVCVLGVVVLWNRRLRREIERRRQAEKALERRNSVLESISEKHTLQEILTRLVRGVEQDNPGVMASVLLLDAQGKHLRLGVAPSLPEAFNEAVDGLAIGPGAGFCGHAAYAREPVVADDLLQHPYWEPYHELVRQSGLGACWAVPIFSTEQAVLGTFALYHRQPHTPSAEEMALLGEASAQAALAIEHFANTALLRKLSLAVEFSPNAIVITDREGRIEYVNPRFSEISGFEAADVIGRSPAILQSGNTPEEYYRVLWNTVLSGEDWRGEMQNRRKDGSLYWVHELISPIRGDADEVTHFVCIQEDVTESREINERLSFQASHDALTGLYNRHEFERRLALAVRNAQEQGEEHTLCFLDLDQFKVVNDTSGHVAGDQLLQQFAKLLQGQLRRGDSLARFGGDEFAILMENCPVPRAHAKVEVLRQMAEEFRFAWEDKTFRIGISVGLAKVNSDSGNAGDALRHADTACYMAKDAGRNRIRVYRADDDDLQGRGGDMHWLSRINHALENTGFVLFVQEVVRSGAGQVASAYEVLLRMRDADGGLALPGAFLPAAERYNLAIRIDRWVIATLFDWIKLHQAELAPDTTFAVNLSGQSLGDTELLGYLVDQFESGVVPGGRIKFEVTETAAIANLATAKTYIATLKAYGVEFALDDFGSGLSSFAYLKNLDVDYLKIDGMFVRDILNDPLDAAMVRSINEIGHVMGMQTIAEFVENEGILKQVGEMGVDFAQGYGVGHPRPIETLLARVERQAV